jgi:hypothetical protein
LSLLFVVKTAYLSSILPGRDMLPVSILSVKTECAEESHKNGDVYRYDSTCKKQTQA